MTWEGAASQDQWGQSARDFYGRELQAKQDPRRCILFSRAYRRVAGILPVSPQSTLLDVGCGAGEMAQALRGQIRAYCGVDISRDSLLLAREREPEGQFICADMISLPLSARFDVAVAMTSLEFCYDKLRALREIGRVLCDTGQLYVEVRNGDFALLRFLAPFVECLLRWGWIAPYEAEGFRDLCFDEWRALLAKAGFRIVRLQRSLRPVLYGNVRTWIKNLLIRTVAFLAPIRWHYMVGFVCVRNVGSERADA